MRGDSALSSSERSHGAGRERSVNPILPEEAEKLRRLLLRVEEKQINHKVYFPKVRRCRPPATVRLLGYYDIISRKHFHSPGKGKRFCTIRRLR
jgi:hypothetical protein